MISFDSMKPTIYISLLFVTLLSVVAGCKRNSGGVIKGGGKGGSETIRATAEHSGTQLDTAIVYIKYASLDAPADSIYDDSLVCTVVNDTPVAVFSGLTTGNYFLMAKGVHKSICPSVALGGKPFTAATEKSDWVVITTYCQN